MRQGSMRVTDPGRLFYLSVVGGRYGVPFIHYFIKEAVIMYNKRGIEIREPIRTSFKEFDIVAKYKGMKSAHWDADSYTRHYVITVTGVNTRSPKISFDFWTSRAHAVMSKPREVVKAFAVFLRDSQSADGMTFEEFADYSGYLPFCTKESITEAKKAYRRCVNAAKKWAKMGYSEEDTEELLEALEDAGFC
jgi:hypothetical protein